jgi:hypothetical protein
MPGSANLNINRTDIGVLMKGRSRKFEPRLTVSLTRSNYETLNALAEKGEVSVSWVVRRAIDEYLGKHWKEISPADGH